MDNNGAWWDTESVPDAFERMSLDDATKIRGKRLETAIGIYMNNDKKFLDVISQRIVFQGPGGGYYYMNEKGEKTYIRKDKLAKMKLIPQ